jgi:hypothetical protein
MNADATLLLPSSANLFTQSHKLVKFLMGALNVVIDNATLDHEGVRQLSRVSLWGVNKESFSHIWN